MTRQNLTADIWIVLSTYFCSLSYCLWAVEVEVDCFILSTTYSHILITSFLPFEGEGWVLQIKSTTTGFICVEWNCLQWIYHIWMEETFVVFIDRFCFDHAKFLLFHQKIEILKMNWNNEIFFGWVKKFDRARTLFSKKEFKRMLEFQITQL
jgi:hypothetical protein